MVGNDPVNDRDYLGLATILQIPSGLPPYDHNAPGAWNPGGIFDNVGYPFLDGSFETEELRKVGTCKYICTSVSRGQNGGCDYSNCEEVTGQLFCPILETESVEGEDLLIETAEPYCEDEDLESWHNGCPLPYSFEVDVYQWLFNDEDPRKWTPGDGYFSDLNTRQDEWDEEHKREQEQAGDFDWGDIEIID